MRHPPGSLTLALACWICIATSAGLGLWLLMHRWNGLTQTQLRLDHCVGSRAGTLRDLLNSINRSNQRITALRAAIVAAVATPEIQAPLQTALHLEVLHQDAQRARWLVVQSEWILKGGCDRRRDRSWPLPAPDWERPPADIIGERPLEWGEGERPNEFLLQLDHSPREAAARVWFNEQSNRWRAEWVSPRSGGPGFH